MNLTQKINRFRQLLFATFNDMGDPDSLQYMDDLIKNYNDLFPEKIFSEEMDYLRDLTLKYCHKEGHLCPICGSTTTRLYKKDRKAAFLGCTAYPKCRGARSTNGAPTINDAMREFLAQKVREEHGYDDVDSNRFRDLDL
jgi:hypothetical protein